MAATSYAVGLGSNRRGRHGAPEAEVRAAVAALPGVVRTAPTIRTAPLGPSIRQFANTVAIIETDVTPPALLAELKRIERAFGRRRGRRWGERVIDLDVLLWSGGAWTSPGLAVPHPSLRERLFVLEPLAAVAPDWRDPVSGRTVRQLLARARRRR